MKVIIAGSRGFIDYMTLVSVVDRFHALTPISAVISGTARGADQLGERWAYEHRIPVIRMPAEWDRYGKSAGYRRNEEMAKIADALIAFWDGQSRGTRHMIDIARRHNLRTEVII